MGSCGGSRPGRGSSQHAVAVAEEEGRCKGESANVFVARQAGGDGM